MARKQVLYFFAFGSPFAALADLRIDALMAKVGAELVPIPIVPPPNLNPPPQGLAATIQEFRQSYVLEDAKRWADKLGMQWNPGSASDTTNAVAGYYMAREKGKEREYRNQVFRARWSEGRDIDNEDVLAECAAKAGLNRKDFLDALASQKYHQDVPQALQRCVEHRIFGVPTFVVDNQRFWGNDRVDLLMEELARGS